MPICCRTAAGASLVSPFAKGVRLEEGLALMPRAPPLEEGSEGNVELEALGPFGLAGAAVLNVVVRVVEEVPPLPAGSSAAAPHGCRAACGLDHGARATHRPH